MKVLLTRILIAVAIVGTIWAVVQGMENWLHIERGIRSFYGVAVEVDKGLAERSPDERLREVEHLHDSLLGKLVTISGYFMAIAAVALISLFANLIQAMNAVRNPRPNDPAKSGTMIG